MRFQLLFFILVSHAYIAFTQTLPTAPNKRNAQGQRIGEWVIYYSKTWKETAIPDSIAFYSPYTFENGKPIGKITQYYRTGEIWFMGAFSAIEPEFVREGLCTLYYKNGNKSSEAFYVKNKQVGIVKSWYENGQPQHQYEMKNGQPEGLVRLWNGKGDSTKLYFENGKPLLWKVHAQKVMLLHQQGKYSEAIPLAEKGIKIALLILGDLHPDYVQSLNDLAILYKKQGEYSKAEPLYLQALTIRKKTLGEEHPNYAMSLYNLAALYESQGQYSRAEPYYVQILEITKKSLGEAHHEYAVSLNNLALLYERQGEYSKAETHYLQALAIKKKTFGEEHPSYATGLNNLAYLYKRQGQYVKAEPLYLRALVIVKKTLWESHPDYVMSLHNMAALYESQGQYNKAEPLYEQVLAITKKSFGEGHPNYAMSLNNLASFYKSQGQYNKAEPLYEQALEIRKKSLGINHPDYAASLNNLAALYYRQGEYNKAESLFDQALEIIKKTLGKAHSTYAMSLNNLAKLYESQRQYRKAEPLFLEALAITKKSFGEAHPNYALSLDNLAGVYYSQYQYAKAEPLYIEALAITKKTLGEKHPDYAMSLKNLAGLYHRQGQYSKAEPLLLEALAITKKSLGEKHPDYAVSLSALAGLYYSRHQYVKAELLYVEVLEIRKESLGEAHPNYAMSLNDLAVVYHSQGQYSKAETLLLETLMIKKKSLREADPTYASSLNNLAELYHNQNQFAKAELLYVEALAITKKSLGEAHPDYAQSLNNLAALYHRQSQYSNAEPYFLESYQINKENLFKFFETASEQQQEDFFKTQEAPMISGYSWVEHTSAMQSWAYDYALFVKGLRLASSANLLAYLRQSTDTSLNYRYERYLMTKRALHLKYSLPIAQRYGVAELENEAEQLEKDLARLSAAYRSFKQYLQITHKQIQKALKPNEAAIEFVHFQYHNGKRWTDSTYYAALVLRPGWEAPRMVKLFEEGQLRSLFQDTVYQKYDDAGKVATLYRGAEVVPIAAVNDGKLYQLIWQPLDSLLGGVKIIHYSPSGLLHRLSMSAIPMPNGQLLHDKYTLNYLSSTRALVSKEPAFQLNPTQRVAFFGDVRYYADSVSIKSALKAKSLPKENLTQANIRPKKSDGSRGKEWTQLEGTAKEITAISQLCQKAKLNTTLYTNYAASEDNFKALADTGKVSPQVLHIATHGFFYADSSQQKAADLNRSLSGEQRVLYAANPLERSGLVLAGANHYWKNEKAFIGLDDGILRASEVATLNLINTQLVVLSACETGLGDINGSEGVFGLQRAFKMAGVKYLLMSLWQVPDEKTAEMMKEFYGNLLKPQPIETAFRNAQDTLRKKTNYSVYDWAGFVLIK